VIVIEWLVVGSALVSSVTILELVNENLQFSVIRPDQDSNECAGASCAQQVGPICRRDARHGRLRAMKKDREQELGSGCAGKTASAWATDWDTRIAAWLKSGSRPDLASEAIYDAYKPIDKKSGTQLQLDYLPEPYVGDALASDLDAVALTLNPGGACFEQRPRDPARGLADGPVAAHARTHGWRLTANDWGALAGPTLCWWSGLGRFAAAIVERPPSSHPRIVGIDLVPWHSPGFGKVQFGRMRKGRPRPDGASWLVDNVICPASLIARSTRLTACLNGENGKSVALGVTNHLAYLLRRGAIGFQLDFGVDAAVAKKVKLEWGATERRIEWLVSAEFGLIVIVLIAQRPLDAMSAPEELIAKALRRLLNEPDLRAQIRKKGGKT
jgi:hypothetical protein